MNSRLIRVENGSIYVESSGRGSPLILIHAGYLDRRMWDEQFDWFSEKFKVIRYDVRGYGNSTIPVGTYSDARDLKKVIESLGLEEVIIIGVSNGGRIALDFAVENPSAVGGLILVDSGVSGYKPETSGEEHIWDQYQQLEEMYKQLIKEGNFRGAGIIDVDLWTSKVTNKVREKLLEIAEENAKKSSEFEQNLQTSPTPPAFERLDQLKMPVLVILGSMDLPGSILQGKRIHRQIPGSQLTIIEGADHIPSLSKAVEFNTKVMDFLNKVERLKAESVRRIA